MLGISNSSKRGGCDSPFAPRPRVRRDAGAILHTYIKDSRLLLPLRHPCAIGTSFHAHPPLARIAVNPTGHECMDRARRSLGAFLRPLTCEREFHITVPPSAGDRKVFPEWAGPRSGHNVSVAVQFH